MKLTSQGDHTGVYQCAFTGRDLVPAACEECRPQWAGQIALHHGSLDKAVREWVEQSLKAGTLRAVVATSSLDLGVDFLPVERVLQIGSARAWPGCCSVPAAVAMRRAAPAA